MQLLANPVSRQRISPLFMTLALLGSFLPIISSSALLVEHLGALATSFHGNHSTRWTGAQPPTYAECVAAGYVCYSPQEERRAYNLKPIVDAGYNGQGQTIIIIDSYGSPTAWTDLQQFDKDYNLAPPAFFKQLAPIGAVPFDPTNNDMVGWAEETSLDIQWAHAMAPRAGIIVLTSPVSETEGVQGLPEFLQLEEYAVDHHLGNIITQSWGATENTLFTPQGEQVLNDFNAFYKRAAEQHVTVLASSGDSGSSNIDVNNNTYPFPTVGFPASSPWVTAVGGTSLYANPKGTFQSETVWNNAIGASGGGISQYFKEPDYQSTYLPGSTKAELKGYRGLPDISSNADPDTGVPVLLGFLGTNSGYYVFGGTSESSPTWAGIIADANQYVGHPLGFLNPKLYKLGHESWEYKEDFHDIVGGDNSQQGVPGYPATVGWDLATGWGSPVASKLFMDFK